MVSMQAFIFGLMICSTLTALATEAVKKIMTEHNKTYYANTLAGIVSMVLSVGFSVGYILLNDLGFTTQTIVLSVALVFMSWLCAMVGYDKVIQAISQFKTSKN